jgi:DNA-binding IclR family transcriptional regulator
VYDAVAMIAEQKPLQPDPEGDATQGASATAVSAGTGHITRAFTALEALVEGPRTAASIARVLGVNRSTALRLMTELESIGYVRRDPEDKRYSTVPARFYSLIASQVDHADWSEYVDPVLSGLRDEYGEAAIMGVPANGTMVYLAFFPSVHLVAVREQLGTTRPMHCSALGKAYLSALDRRALDGELALLTYRGGTKRAARGPLELREKLQRSRDRGYAIDGDETFDGGTCVAVPLRIGGSIVGAIGLSGPSARFDEDRIAQIGEGLVEASRKLAGSAA